MCYNRPHVDTESKDFKIYCSSSSSCSGSGSNDSSGRNDRRRLSHGCITHPTRPGRPWCIDARKAIFSNAPSFICMNERAQRMISLHPARNHSSQGRENDTTTRTHYQLPVPTHTDASLTTTTLSWWWWWCRHGDDDVMMMMLPSWQWCHGDDKHQSNNDGRHQLRAYAHKTVKSMIEIMNGIIIIKSTKWVHSGTVTIIQ